MKGTLWYTGLNDARLKDTADHFDKLLGRHIEFEFIQDDSLIGGFIAFIDGVAYDMSMRSRLSSLHGTFSADNGEEAPSDGKAIISDLTDCTRKFDFDRSKYSYGNVISSGDGIIRIEGLSGRKYGEVLVMSGGAVAVALEISEETIGAAVLEGSVHVGEQVSGTDRVLDVPVGDALLGRVLEPIGKPLDGGPAPKCVSRMPIEHPSPKIMDRKGVSRPLETGLLSIDSMIPIGRGQRELIIGDRQTGKTTIAIDTILNQKGRDVICVYCAIGQKASTVAEIVDTLREHGAMDYTVVVSSPASDLPAMQYIAPYAACAMAEGFMYAGRDALVIYDDLSKHAVAYRAMSLLLHRPPGREAYPGDVFYLHSRLLERSAQLSDELGGGSLTAIPIVETMAGDISAYIPTNVISITDGQIFLESELFHSGMRPAVNVGLSVSRVGRSAQHPAMRKVAGTLRLDLAQYRELSVFLQFGADVDSATKAMLESGERKNELLKQPKHRPYSLSQQICLFIAADTDVFSDVPAAEVGAMSEFILSALAEKDADKLALIDKKSDIDEQLKKSIADSIKRAAAEYRRTADTSAKKAG